MQKKAKYGMNLSIQHHLYSNTSKDFSLKDYYPFGMVMPGRNFAYENYQFGFNGMFKDDELKGSGNSYDFGARIYDPRIGRWLSLDPLAQKYPFASPYNFTLNNPVKLTDPDGRYVRGDKTTSLSSFLKVLKLWEVEAIKYRETSTAQLGVDGPIVVYESENHAKIRIFDTDFRATKQLVNDVGGQKGFSYNQAFGKYLDVGLPLDIAHFMKVANLAQDYSNSIVRQAYINEEFNQAKDIRPAGRTSAFAPEDLFSNELGVIFGNALGKDDNFSTEFETLMTEVNTLFTTNQLLDGKYLTESNINRLRDIAEKYYGTTDLTTFNKSSDIYELDNIKKINDNAASKDYPFHKTETGN